MNYCYASHVSEAIKKVHTDAFSQYTKAIPCLSFTNVGLKTDGDGNDAVAGGTAECNASPAVYITTSKSGCWSYVGELSYYKTQGYNIGSGCESLGIVMHEIAHALGQGHEQSRSDRDTYVTINWSSIETVSGRARIAPRSLRILARCPKADPPVAGLP